MLAVGREGRLKHEAIGDPGRRATHPLRLLVAGADGEEAIAHTDVVIDATGGIPNRRGDGGIDAVNERLFEDRIERYLPRFEAQAELWAGRTILLTGAGHSAQTAAVRLAEFARDAPGTHIVWAVRNPARLGRGRRRPAARAGAPRRRRRVARRRRERRADRASRPRHRGDPWQRHGRQQVDDVSGTLI